MKIKTEIFIITFFALFVLSSFFSSSLNSNLIKTEKNIQHDEINEIDEFRTPRKSWFNNSMDPIFIDNSASNNWTWASKQAWCFGDGSWGNPYIIENVTIDAGDLGSGILIENSKNVYFEIKNCTVYNSGRIGEDAGIKLYNTTNGKIINNTCSLNLNGIRLKASNNNTVSGNTANNNSVGGIILKGSNNNTVSGNAANNNEYGIFIQYGNNNTISNNTANKNTVGGIILRFSNNNTVSGNTASNNNLYGIYLFLSNNNTVSGNTLIGNVFFIYESPGCINNTIIDNTCYTTILPAGISEFEIEPYNVDKIDVSLSLALNNPTEVLFSAFGNNTSDVPLDNELIFMDLRLNDSDNLNQTLNAPINITLKYDVSKYKTMNTFWFNEDANGKQGAWEEISFTDLGNGIIVISVDHTSLFALTGELKSFPLSNGDDDDDINDEINILLIIIIAIIIGIVSSITASSTYYYKTRSKTRARPTKKEALMRKPLVKSFDEKVVKSQNLKDFVENKNVLRILKEKIALDNPALFHDVNTTFISNEFWEKMGEFELDDKDKEEFINEILSFTPKERQELLDDLLKLRELDLENANQQESL